MKIVSARSRTVRVPLTRPYAIAGGSWDSVDLVVCEINGEDGAVGYGQASPAVEVTRETIEACATELATENLAWLVGRDAHTSLDELEMRVNGPAARAALDMALHDLAAKGARAPLVLQLGRVQRDLATSITIGVMSLSETLVEAAEYFERGFRVFKVKIGVDVDLDIERLSQLRMLYRDSITLRADANQGYDSAALKRFAPHMDLLSIEMLEQPLHPDDDAALMKFPVHLRRRFAADESVHDERDIERLARGGSPFGIVNVKLMKCGGIRPALRIASAAERAGLALMWGCMDESVLGISAALNAAYASRATRYLDLDGSFDLAADPFTGGFELVGDELRTLESPGLGAQPA